MLPTGLNPDRGRRRRRGETDQGFLNSRSEETRRHQSESQFASHWWWWWWWIRHEEAGGLFGFWCEIFVIIIIVVMFCLGREGIVGGKERQLKDKATRERVEGNATVLGIVLASKDNRFLILQNLPPHHHLPWSFSRMPVFLHVTSLGFVFSKWALGFFYSFRAPFF